MGIWSIFDPCWVVEFTVDGDKAVEEVGSLTLVLRYVASKCIL